MGTPLSREAKSEVELEIGHILFIDTVGYSKLTINEQRELQELLNRIVRATDCFRTAEAAGKLIRLPTGDGMALVFADDIEAPLRCALEVCRELQGHPELPVRMGIHSGPVSRVVDVNDRVNVAGAGVNVAQRVMSCGDAGHILLSRRVAEDLAPYRQWQPFLHKLGECEVKHGQKIEIVNFHSGQGGNAAVPVRLEQAKRERDLARHGRVRRRITLVAAAFVIAAAMAAAVVYRYSTWQSVNPPIPEKSIAVLPFENRSDEKSNAYLADGIQDEILTRLAKIADLKVISRTSTQQYRSKPENLSVIARQLGVTHVLEGSVQKNADRVRVNVQLIRAATDSHVWADTFDRQLSDIFFVESEIAKTIADQLRAKITGQEEQAITTRPTENPEAYDAYLRGLAYTIKAGNASADVISAQKYLRDAVSLDPKFALAWALLSYIDSTGYLTAGLPPTSVLREEARQAAETARTLQPDLGEAALAVGQYHYACLKDYDTAVRYFEEARRLLPNSSRIPQALAYVARRRGHWDRSDSYFNEAERLDPRNLKIMTEHASLFESRRQFSEALRKSDQVLNIVPDDLNMLTFQASIAQAQGDLDRASSLLARLGPNPSDAGVMFANTYQCVLEKRRVKITSAMRETLETRDATLANFAGELRFWLGWAERTAGDHAAAEQHWHQGREELERLLKNQPDNNILIGDLALINMALGNKAEALSLAKRAMAVNPIEKDAISGPGALEVFARVAAQVGERDAAIAALQKLLSIPYSGPIDVPLTSALLRLDPMFDPIRNDPEFQKLASSGTK